MMSSHWEWADEVIAEHAAKRPYAPENGDLLKFKAGDAVIFTNDYGVEFHTRVTGLWTPKEPCTFYARGYRYTLDKESYWFPAKETSLRPDPQAMSLNIAAPLALTETTTPVSADA
jgi:hypothetical protein